MIRTFLIGFDNIAIPVIILGLLIVFYSKIILRGSMCFF